MTIRGGQNKGSCDLTPLVFVFLWNRAVFAWESIFCLLSAIFPHVPHNLLHAWFLIKLPLYHATHSVSMGCIRFPHGYPMADHICSSISDCWGVSILLRPVFLTAHQLMLISPSLRTNGHIRLLPAWRTYFVLYFSSLVACVHYGVFPFEATV